MSNVLEKWLKAQNGELDCWINVKNKILTSDYLEAKKRYYNELLSIIKNFIKKSRSFLDIGCGPSGIFISLLNKDFRRVGIDSLMNDYLKNFPYLSQLGVNWINNSFEGEYFTEKFDTIFILNALDHMQNPEQVIKKYLLFLIKMVC